MASSQEQQPMIIVQGGGYRTMISDDHIYKRVTEKAANEGYDILKRNTSGEQDDQLAIEAVEHAVRVFEEDDHFNAGRGSCLTYKTNKAPGEDTGAGAVTQADEDTGRVECDAMIMDGNKMKTGAVMTVSNFVHPVSLARLVMDRSIHCALSGNGALEFAREKGFEIVDSEELKGNYPNQQVAVGNKDFTAFSGYVYNGEPVKESRPPQNSPQTYDTVSAVAMDKNGHLACAMSTGGIHGKHRGRVSDAALVGCGGYANESGAATTTGHGESIMKMTLAREVVYNMEQGQDAQEAVENALRRMQNRENINGHCGVIAIDRDGNFGKACTTPVMVWASKKNDQLESDMMKQTLF